jgi:hypothetical protein
MGTTATRLSNPPAPLAGVPTCDYIIVKLLQGKLRIVRLYWPNIPIGVSPTLDGSNQCHQTFALQTESEIVHLDACGLVEKLATSVYSAVEVLTAFCKVAVASQDLTNCLTGILFKEGLEAIGRPSHT